LKKIAAIVTEYRPGSHADVIVGKFLQGFPTDDGLLKPRVEIASLFLDQVPDVDMGMGIAAEFGVPVYDSINAALCLGGKELAVDGVLLIGEHGDYAWNEKAGRCRSLTTSTCPIIGQTACGCITVPRNWARLLWAGLR
jgi:hypothetical protein